MEVGAEGVLFGEMLDYTMRYAVDLSLAIIEAGHGSMENPGLRKMAEALEVHCPGAKVHFVDSGGPWRFVWFNAKAQASPCPKRCQKDSEKPRWQVLLTHNNVTWIASPRTPCEA